MVTLPEAWLGREMESSEPPGTAQKDLLNQQLVLGRAGRRALATHHRHEVGYLAIIELLALDPRQRDELLPVGASQAERPRWIERLEDSAGARAIDLEAPSGWGRLHGGNLDCGE